MPLQLPIRCPKCKSKGMQVVDSADNNLKNDSFGCLAQLFWPIGLLYARKHIHIVCLKCGKSLLRK